MKTTNAANLATREARPMRYIIDGLIPEGLTILAGSSKIGKSWLCLHLALAVAGGHKALDSIDIKKAGNVLYLALEDGENRLQNRLETLLDGEPAPDTLDLATDAPDLYNGLIDELEAHYAEHPDLCLVIIDVWAKVKPDEGQRSEGYAAETRYLSMLKTFADSHHIGVLVVHHTKKGFELDSVDALLGSRALSSVPDTILVIRRKRSSNQAELEVTGRDVQERTITLEREQDDPLWKLTGDPSKASGITPEQAHILSHFNKYAALDVKQLAPKLGKNENTTRRTLNRMVSNGLLMRPVAGQFALPDAEIKQADDKPNTGVNTVVMPMVADKPLDKVGFYRATVALGWKWEDIAKVLNIRSLHNVTDFDDALERLKQAPHPLTRCLTVSTPHQPRPHQG